MAEPWVFIHDRAVDWVYNRARDQPHSRVGDYAVMESRCIVLS
jgi:hypothetical protein